MLKYYSFSWDEKNVLIVVVKIFVISPEGVLSKGKREKEKRFKTIIIVITAGKKLKVISAIIAI